MPTGAPALASVLKGRFEARHRIGHRWIVVDAFIQVARHILNVALASSMSRGVLPAPHLELKACPVGGRFLVAPLHLRRVTLAVMRQIEKFTTALGLGARRKGQDNREHGNDQGAGLAGFGMLIHAAFLRERSRQAMTPVPQCGDLRGPSMRWQTFSFRVSGSVGFMPGNSQPPGSMRPWAGPMHHHKRRRGEARG